MKKKFTLLTVFFVVFAVCAEFVSAQSTYNGLTYVCGPYYISNGFNRNEYLYDKGGDNYLYGYGTYTPGDQLDNRFLWNVYTDGSRYFLENASSHRFMECKEYSDHFWENGRDHNSWNLADWGAYDANYYALSIAGYDEGEDSFTTNSLANAGWAGKDSGEWAGRPLENGYDFGRFDANSDANKVYSISGNYTGDAKKWTFTKVSQEKPTSISLTPEKLDAYTGEKVKVKVTTEPACASSSVTWSVSEGATIDDKGNVTITYNSKEPKEIIVKAVSKLDGSVVGTTSIFAESQPEMKLSVKNSSSVECLGNLITYQIETLPDNFDPKEVKWMVYKNSQWEEDPDVHYVNGSWIGMADNLRHRVVYADLRTNSHEVVAAVCCSSEADSYPLWKQDFGTLPGNCDRKDITGMGITVSGGMQYSNKEIDDGYYAIVANPGCTVFGKNGDDSWFYDREDHTPGDNNGGMLLVNNGAQQSVIFQQEFPSPCQSATVDFSGWFINICRKETDCGKPVNVDFKVWGQFAGTTQWEEIRISNMSTGNIPWSDNPTWLKKNTSFNTDKYDMLRVQVINRGTSGQGNDMALDDIEMVSCSPQLNLYTDIDTYATSSVACRDTTIVLVPKAPFQIDQLYKPMYYMLQYQDADGKWKAYGDISTPATNAIPNWDIETNGLKEGSTFFRVVMGNDPDVVQAIANGQKPESTQCLLYTVTNKAEIQKKKVHTVADETVDACVGVQLTLPKSGSPEKPGSESASWAWYVGSKLLCQGKKNDAVKNCTQTLTVTAPKESPSIYTYVAEDSFGCTDTTRFEVKTSQPRYNFLDDDEICEGDNSKLTLKICDGKPPYTFDFINNGTTVKENSNSDTWEYSLSGLKKGEYKYSVDEVRDANNCKATLDEDCK